MASHISWQFSLTFGGPSFSPQSFTNTAIFCHIFVVLVPLSKDPFKSETVRVWQYRLWSFQTEDITVREID